MFDRNSETGYLHYLFSGHVRECMERFGSLAILSGENYECQMGEMKNAGQRTSRGAFAPYAQKLAYFANDGFPIDPFSENGKGSVSIALRKYLDENHEGADNAEENINNEIEHQDIDYVESDSDSNDDGYGEEEADDRLEEPDDRLDEVFN